MIILASLWPTPIASPTFPAKTVTLVGVAIIFLVQGLTLRIDELAKGMVDWKHHTFCLSWNFIAFPLISGLIAIILAPWLDRSLVLGIVFLGLLPTTISSAVALTATANGNVPAAVISTVLSNLIGVIFTPALSLLIIVSAAGVDIPIFGVLKGVAMQIVLPMVVGQILRPWIPKVIDTLRPFFRPLNNSIILLILYISFCQSFAGGVWAQAGSLAVMQTLVAALLMLLMGSFLIFKTSKALHFPPKTQISAYFCSSQKTLAMGVPIAGSLLIGDSPYLPAMGLFILPLICYHALQLALGGILASRWQHQKP